MALLSPGARCCGRRARWLALVFLSTWVLTPLQAQKPTFNERELKAVFLLNFARFVEWPASAFERAQSPIVIGVLGDDPFGRVLDGVVEGEMAMNRPLTVQRFAHAEGVVACHILFVSLSDDRRYEQLLASLRGRPILTVGDSEGFATRGGMIRFVTERNRIRLRVNVEAAKAAGLTLSSRLLRAAEIVRTSRTP